MLGDALVSGLGSRLLVGMAHDLVNHVLRAVLDLLGHQLEAGLLLRGQPRHAVIEEDDRSIGCNLLLGGNDGSGRGGSSCRSCGIGRGGELGLRGGKLLCQLGILDLHGGGSGHAGGYGVLESLDVRNGIARNTALPAALVKAVGETCRSAEAEQVGAVHRNGADPRRRYQPFEFDIEIERRRNAELVEPAQSERERLVRTRTVVLVALVGEVRGHISETGERHGIVGSVFTVTPCPVGEVEHEIGMHEQIGPFRLAQHIVEIGEPAALQLEAHTGHRMEPFGKAEVSLEIDTVAETPLVGTVGKGRTGTASKRNFPVIPETVRHETGKARFFGRILRPHRRSQCHGCQQ